MVHRVILTEAALDDLTSISDYLAEVAGEDVAAAYDAQLKAACLSLTEFPNRGRPRGQFRPGLRSIPFARLATIFYVAEKDQVQVVRVIHARRDLAAAFEDRRDIP